MPGLVDATAEGQNPASLYTLPSGRPAVAALAGYPLPPFSPVSVVSALRGKPSPRNLLML